MLATSFRPRFAVLSVLVAVTLALAAWPRAGHRCQRARPSLHTSIAQSRVLYREGDFARAAHTLQQAAADQPIEVASELHVVATFYRQLGHALAAALESAKRGPSSTTLHHLDQALQFDGMLGGVFRSDLIALRRDAYLAIDFN